MKQEEKEPRNLFESLPGCMVIPFTLVSRALREIEAWANLAAYREIEHLRTGQYPKPTDPEDRA